MSRIYKSIWRQSQDQTMVRALETNCQFVKATKRFVAGKVSA